MAAASTATSCSTCAILGPQVILKKLPQIHEMALDYLGIDMIKEPVPVRPGMHYQMGGVKTDVDGRRPCRACTQPAKSRASASTAATALARTRCSTRSSSAGAPGKHAAAYVKSVPESNGGEELLRIRTEADCRAC